MWAKLEDRGDAAGLISSELRALWKGDVPFFYTLTDSTDILDEQDQRHPNLLTRSCLDEVVEHIQRLDASDLQRQRWFIKGTMACQKLLLHEDSGASGGGDKGSSYQQVPGAEVPVRDVFLQEARRVGDRIAELALRGRGEEGATWVGMVFLHEKIWQFLPLGIDLYNGLSGIALFLAYLGKASGERRYTDLARDCLTVIRRQQRNSEKGIVINGGFTGWGGLLYLYTHLYSLWREPQLLEEALHCARQMRAHVDKDEDCEIIYGSAGGLLTLNGLYEVHPEPEVLELMRLCGQRILSRAQPMARGGVGWSSKSMGTMPLAGFSHGSSGIATALEILHRRTGEGRYLEAAAGALAYERALFSPEHGNWRDMRFGKPDLDAPLPDKFPVVWCNGAPGIGLARLRMRSLADAMTREEIAVALDTTRREGFGYTHSLCHGDLGNLELFLEAREAGLETPGLMTGLAGIGFGFLRLYDAAGTPSMLLLDPPR
jgi:type 2 lantibiotic biosynthesis protein LanM